MSDSKTLNLLEEFPPVPVAQWEAVIQADLKGADYEKKLVWRTEEGLNIRPYYTAENLESIQNYIDVTPGQYPFLRGHGLPWVDTSLEEAPKATVEADVWHDAGATAVQEIAFALAAGVEQLAAQVSAGESVDQAAPRALVRFAIGANVFMEVAKLRAARQCWALAVGEFQPQNAESSYLHIHAVTALANKTIYDPYNNLLRNTAEGFAAVVGGCDWLTVRAFHYEDRLAVNLQRILREESRLDQVADPAGGSYYLESLTLLLAREAWKLFQQIEAAGGYAAYVASGALNEAIGAARKAKEQAIASRRRVLVGTNNYPNWREQALDATADDELQSWRLAGVFERIRLRTERHVRAGGRLPRFVLLEMGDLKMRQARSNFIANLLGCAGFQIETVSIADPNQAHIEAADAIVLCSSDPEYATLLPLTLAQNRVPVLIAGYPKDQVQALEAAGAAGFLHLGSNVIETLTDWQNKLGLAS